MGSFVKDKILGLGGQNTGNADAGATGATGAGTTAVGNAATTFAWGQNTANNDMAQGNAIAAQQRGVAGMANDESVNQWNQYQNLFQPVNTQAVNDAMNYDSQDQMARVRQAAAGNANEAFDTSIAANNATLTRMGVNPNSARFADPNATSLARAQAVAGSENTATANRNDTAIGLRANAANLGQNVFGSGVSAAGLSTNANSAAANTLNTTASTGSAIQGNPTTWEQTGISGLTGGGGLSQQGVNTNVNARTSLVNSALGMLSDENVKEEISDVDEDAVLAGLKRIPVKAWKYKDGVADSGRHVGPMAQDMHREFGDRVAPGGKQLSMVSMHGLALLSIKALARQVDRLSAGLRPTTAGV